MQALRICLRQANADGWVCTSLISSPSIASLHTLSPSHLLSPFSVAVTKCYHWTGIYREEVWDTIVKVQEHGIC